jgi:hypothetical protein
VEWSAEVEAKRRKIRATGCEFVEVFGPKGAPCGHRKWVGKTLSITGDEPGCRTLDEALADGLLSAGCEHDVAVVLDLS